MGACLEFFLSGSPYHIPFLVACKKRPCKGNIYLTMSLYYTGLWWFDLHIRSLFSLHNIRLVSRMPHVSSWERFLNSLVTHSSDVRSSTLSPYLIPEEIHKSFLQYWHVKGWKVCSLGNRSTTVTLHRWLRVNPSRLLGAGNVGFDLFRAVSLQSQSRTST